MSLLDALSRLDIVRANVFDPATGCELWRDEDGDVVVARRVGNRYTEQRLCDLMRGPCAGLRGTILESRIREVMNGLCEEDGRYDTPIEEEA